MSFVYTRFALQSFKQTNKMTYKQILKEFELYTSDPILSNQKLMFMGSGIFATFTVNDKWNQSRIICPVYIATNKGYTSADWKKNPLSKMEFELTKDSYKKVLPFIQADSPNSFIPAYALGVNKANVLANHLKGSDPYDRG